MALKALPILLHGMPSSGRPNPPARPPSNRSRSRQRSGGGARRLIAVLAIVTATLSGTLAQVSASLDDPGKGESYGPVRLHDEVGLSQHPAAGPRS
jgi:hypothetical protein